LRGKRRERILAVTCGSTLAISPDSDNVCRYVLQEKLPQRKQGNHNRRRRTSVRGRTPIEDRRNPPVFAIPHLQHQAATTVSPLHPCSDTDFPRRFANGLWRNPSLSTPFSMALRLAVTGFRGSRIEGVGRCEAWR
jgi:hypothetical protein